MTDTCPSCQREIYTVELTHEQLAILLDACLIAEGTLLAVPLAEASDMACDIGEAKRPLVDAICNQRLAPKETP